MKKRLTPKTIDALQPADNKRYEVRDQLLPGLHLRVSAAGGRVFYVSKRIDRRMKRIRIGAWPILSLHEARDEARSILREIELGRYNEKALHIEQPTPTLGDVVPQFIDLYAKQQTKDWKGTERIHQKFAPLFPARSIKSNAPTLCVCSIQSLPAVHSYGQTGRLQRSKSS
ncbi:MAG: Arm DNA-binding domain-containing protein [Alphaproteobacteria bacterium]|nr:Arm DNA-binding domain-containing protein [Alphaproteobacteria bacterium]